jgi:hypothetical protein
MNSDFEKYLKVIGSQADRVLTAVPPQRWASFAKAVLARKNEVPQDLTIVAENLNRLVSPQRREYFASSVDLMDGFGVSVATAEKLFDEVVMGKQAKGKKAQPSKKTAAKEKLASLTKAGYAPPVLKTKKGEIYIPDLTDKATREAFIKYAKTKGVTSEDMSLVLSVEANRRALKKSAMPRRPKPPRNAPPYWKPYPDSEKGALEFARENILGFDTAQRVSAIPDPQVEDVWMVYNHDDQTAFIVYLYENDFEDTEYESALRYLRRGSAHQYLRRRRASETLSESKFWELIEQCQGDPERLCKVVPKDLGETFANMFHDKAEALSSGEALGLGDCGEDSWNDGTYAVVMDGKEKYSFLAEAVMDDDPEANQEAADMICEAEDGGETMAALNMVDFDECP